MKYAIGIDLGTTNTAIAASLISEQLSAPESFAIAQVLTPFEVVTRSLLPSFLYLPAEAELKEGAAALPWDAKAKDVVGVFARAQGSTTPTRLISSAKSWLSHAGVDRRAGILPFGAPEEVAKLSPLEASSRYLKHVRAAWDAAHPDAPMSQQEVVLTVPASFDAVARELTVEAAKLAGLPETLRLLEEPQAALYSWLADRNGSKQSGAWRNELSVGDVILIVDIGGGTTDFSLIAVREVNGVLELERVAVGDHILLGGDNMDLALAYGVRAKLEQQGTKIDDWQMRALTHACRVGKEALLSDPSLKEHPLAIAGRGSKLMGGTIRAQLTREELQTSLLDGFLPKVEATAKPQAAKRMGLTTLGLPYAADAGITRHLSAFLSRGGAFVTPTAILFNGGVTASPVVRERLLEVMAGWGARPKVLSGANPDLAVSRGAAYYAQARKNGGMRIKGGTVQAYYVGVERAELAVPGVAPKIDALCIAPFGMDEGSEASLSQTFGLVVGEPVSFKFYGSASRRDDKVGTVVEPLDLVELSPIETAFEGESGRVAEVTLQSSITEVGTLELFAVERATNKRWQLSFNVRVQ